MPGRLVMLDRVTQRVIDGYLAEAEHVSEARDRVVP